MRTARRMAAHRLGPTTWALSSESRRDLDRRFHKSVFVQSVAQVANILLEGRGSSCGCFLLLPALVSLCAVWPRMYSLGAFLNAYKLFLAGTLTTRLPALCGIWSKLSLSSCRLTRTLTWHDTPGLSSTGSPIIGDLRRTWRARAAC